jgi:hypothetical protein
MFIARRGALDCVLYSLFYHFQLLIPEPTQRNLNGRFLVFGRILENAKFIGI